MSDVSGYDKLSYSHDIQGLVINVLLMFHYRRAWSVIPTRAPLFHLLHVNISIYIHIHTKLGPDRVSRVIN